ncbi:MAG: uracil phosphoribosyltransferase [Bacteroidetes bacterium]|nr:MAG: uracil phosphoribosyltransferase [Bacteroidota bacterium]
MAHHLVNNKNSLLSQFVAEIRDISIQEDRLRFRRNMERIGEIIAYEMSKELPWVSQNVTTPLADASCYVLQEQPILATILRAGVALHNGLLSYFDKADSAFISAYRKHDSDGKFDIELEYLSCPDISDRILIVSDPMLATGRSMVLTLKALLKEGTPKNIHIVCAIASKQGIEFVETELPEATVWAAAIDDVLNDESYIVPGLGDAGDLAFGCKMQN